MKKKSIVVNYLYNASYSLLNVIIPLITIPYVSRILLAEGVGQVNYAQNLVSYFVLVASLGIPNYGIREISSARDSREKISQTFFEILFINTISTVIAIVLYVVFIITFGSKIERLDLLFVFGIMLIFNVFNIDWFYRGIEEFKYISVRSYAVKLLSVICIFAFVRKQTDVLVYALILSIGYNANYIFNIMHIRKYVTFAHVDIKRCRQRLKPILYMFATAIAVELYAQLDTTMIGAICSSVHVGYYSNVIKLTRIASTVIAAIGTVILPRLTDYYTHGDKKQLNSLVGKTISYIVLISIPSFIGIFSLSDIIVPVIFGNDFSPAIPTLKILSFLIPILCIGNIFGTQLLIVFHKENKLTASVICGAIVNITLNSFLIPRYQQNGAAVASVIAEFVVLIMQIYFNRDTVHISIDLSTIFKIAIQCLTMCILLWLLKNIQIGNTVKMVVCIVTGAIVYGGCGIVIRNKLVLESVQIIKGKFLRVRDHQLNY